MVASSPTRIYITGQPSSPSIFTRRSWIPWAPRPAVAPWSRRNLEPWPRTHAPVPRDPVCLCMRHSCRRSSPPPPHHHLLCRAATLPLPGFLLASASVVDVAADLAAAHQGCGAPSDVGAAEQLWEPTRLVRGIWLWRHEQKVMVQSMLVLVMERGREATPLHPLSPRVHGDTEGRGCGGGEVPRRQ